MVVGSKIVVENVVEISEVSVIVIDSAWTVETDVSVTVMASTVETAVSVTVLSGIEIVMTVVSTVGKKYVMVEPGSVTIHFNKIKTLEYIGGS